MTPTTDTQSRKSGWPKGRPFSPEHRARISGANAGKRRSPEMRARMSEVHAGKTVTPATREKIGASMRAIWAARLNVPLDCMDAYCLYRRKGFSAEQAREALELG